MSFITMILLFLIGVVVGFINIVSAGGSMLTLPFLIFLGLPSQVANGTNRIAILFQNVFALVEFHKKKTIDYKLGFLLSVPTIIASIYGASLAIELPEELFNRMLAIFIIIIIIMMTFKPQQYLPEKMFKRKVSKLLLLVISFTLVGLYGGVMQAGVGFIIIIILLITYPSKKMVEMHSLKTLIITVYLSVSTFVFIFNGLIDWKSAIILALGSSIGGSLGGKFSLLVPNKILENILLVVVVIVGIKLFFS